MPHRDTIIRLFNNQHHAPQKRIKTLHLLNKTYGSDKPLKSRCNGAPLGPTYHRIGSYMLKMKGSRSWWMCISRNCEGFSYRPPTADSAPKNLVQHQRIPHTSAQTGTCPCDRPFHQDFSGPREPIACERLGS
jgi:hypothetical protein